MRRLAGLILLLACASRAGAQDTIPNQSAAGNVVQSHLYQADVDKWVAGIGGRGVLFGAQVTQTTPSSSMAVSVAAGAIVIGQTYYPVSATTVTVTTADNTNPRLDIIVVGTNGVPTVVTGTAAKNPEKPGIPANTVMIGSLFVGKGAAAITTINITDNRVILPPSDQVVNVMGFGAVPDSTTDSTTAIQAAIAAAQAGNGRPVFFPAGPGCYRISAPLVVKGANPVRLFGGWRALDKGSCILNDLTYAPVIYIAGTVPPTPWTYASALVGSGSSLSLTNSDPNTTVDWADAGGPTRINGLAQFSIEGFFKTQDLATGNFYQYVCESSGTVTTSAARTIAFYVKLSNDGRIRGALNVGGSMTEIYSGTGAIVDGTVYQFELSYDGSTVRLFYGIPGGTSTLVGTVSVSGTVSQGEFEDMGCGTGTRVQFPHSGQSDASIKGAIDSLRMSNIARHVATYTIPTTKYDQDGQTLILQNFDNENDQFSVAKSGASNVIWLPKRGQGYTQVAHAEVDHLSIRGVGGAGIQLVGVIDSSFHDLNLYGGMQYGIDCVSDCYLDRFERISSLYPRFPISLPSQAGPNTLANITSTGSIVGIIWGFGSGTLTNTYNTGSTTQWAVILRSGTWAVNGGGVSTEDASGVLWKGAYYLENVQATTFNGIGIESIQNDVPLVTVYGGAGITFLGSRFNSKATTTKIFDITSPMSTPLLVINPMKDQAAVPWATDASVQVSPPQAIAIPTLTGFGTGNAILAGSTWKAMRIDVGTGGVASSGTITFPDAPAPNYRSCQVYDLTSAAAHAGTRTWVTAATTTSITVENQNAAGAATAWTASDKLIVTCENF